MTPTTFPTSVDTIDNFLPQGSNGQQQQQFSTNVARALIAVESYLLTPPAGAAPTLAAVLTKSSDADAQPITRLTALGFDDDADGNVPFASFDTAGTFRFQLDEGQQGIDVGGDIASRNGGNLGAADKPWGDAYVESVTVSDPDQAATAGAIRLKQGALINARNAANDANIALLGTDGADDGVLGAATYVPHDPGGTNLGTVALPFSQLHALWYYGTAIADPSAPPANNGVLYFRDNGGKIELVVRFPTGAVQQIAIEP